MSSAACRESPVWTDYFVRDDSVVADPAIRALLARMGVDEAPRARILEGFAEEGSRTVLLAADANAIGFEVIGVPREIAEVPYWAGFVRILGTPFDDGVIAAPSLSYRIGYYSRQGTLLDSLTVPPPSWRQAREARRGEFADGSDEEIDERIREYLQGISIIISLASIGDSVLVVAHGELVPEQAADVGFAHPAGSVKRTQQGLIEQTRRADIYVGFRRVAADVPVPGEIVGATRSGLLVAESRGVPDDGMLVHYRWK